MLGKFKDRDRAFPDRLSATYSVDWDELQECGFASVLTFHRLSELVRRNLGYSWNIAQYAPLYYLPPPCRAGKVTRCLPRSLEVLRRIPRPF
jgi:hypothetical protein